MKENVEEVAAAIERLVNTFSDEPGQMLALRLTRSHRTLQQSFGKVVFEWVRLQAKAYRTGGYDPRNEMTVRVCERLLQTLEDADVVINDKVYLPCI